MNKKRRGARTSGTEQPRSKKPKESTIEARSRYRPPWKHIGAFVLTAVTLVSALYPFRPQIEIAQATSLDDDDPFETPFTAKNSTWLFSLRNVEISCAALEVVTASHWGIKGFDIGSGRVESISPGESATMPCLFSQIMQTGGRILSADIAISLAFDYPV